MKRFFLLLLGASVCLPTFPGIEFSHQLQIEPVFHQPTRITSSFQLLKNFSIPIEAGIRFSASPDPAGDLCRDTLPWDFSSVSLAVTHSFIDTFSRELSGALEFSLHEDSSVRIGAVLDGAVKHPPFSHLFSGGIILHPPDHSEFHLSGSFLQVLNAQFGFSFFAILTGTSQRTFASGLPRHAHTNLVAGMRSSFISSPDSHHVSIECSFSPKGIIPRISYLINLEFGTM